MSLAHAVPARVRKPTIDSYEWGIASSERSISDELSYTIADVSYLFALYTYRRNTIQRYVVALNELEPLFEGDAEIQIQIRQRIAELNNDLIL